MKYPRDDTMKETKNIDCFSWVPRRKGNPMSHKMKALPFILCAATSVIALGSCFNREEEGDKSLDATKTTLGVKYYNGGLRREWIDKACDAFEKDFADYSFEPGKKGIQIQKDFEKQVIQVDAVTASPYQVFVMENVDYFQFAAKNVMLDVTDVVTNPAPINAAEKENKPIVNKFYDASKDFYGLGEGGGKKYYAIPFYDSSCGINYNVDLFEDKGFYFAENKTAEGLSEADLGSYEKVSELFVQDASEKRSLGPDGKTGVIDGVDYSWDDGLPATYADFHALLTYMSSESVTPIAWNGYEKGYLISLALNLWNSSIGYEEAQNSLTFSGTSTRLLDLDSSYRPKMEKGEYVYASDLSVNGDNVYKVHQQKGLLDACNFAKTIMSNRDYYLAEGMKPSFMHTTAQNYFINGTDDPTLVSKPIGMLVEGAWWNSEATPSYKGNDKKTKRFGILPLPHATSAQIGEDNLTLSDRDSSMFINAACPENLKEAAKTFLGYLNSDRMINIFSEYTDMVRFLKADLTEETLSNMSYFGNRAYQYYSAPNTKHLDWRPQTEAASRKAGALSYRKWGFSVDASNDNPFVYFSNNPKDSGTDLFAKINKYYVTSWGK